MKADTFKEEPEKDMRRKNSVIKSNNALKIPYMKQSGNVTQASLAQNDDQTQLQSVWSFDSDS